MPRAARCARPSRRSTCRARMCARPRRGPDRAVAGAPRCRRRAGRARCRARCWRSSPARRGRSPSSSPRSRSGVGVGPGLSAQIVSCSAATRSDSAMPASTRPRAPVANPTTTGAPYQVDRSRIIGQRGPPESMIVTWVGAPSTCQTARSYAITTFSSTPNPMRSMAARWPSGRGGSNSMAAALSTPSGTVTSAWLPSKAPEEVCTVTPSSSCAMRSTVASRWIGNPSASASTTPR